MKFRVWAGVALFILLAFCGAAIAQELTGTIVGFVKDKTGAVLPNVTVTIRNSATGIARKVVTGGEGEYSAPQLSIGSYDVEIEHTGFKKFIAKSVKLQVGDKLRLDANLEIGTVSEAVTVEGATAAVQTEESSISGVVTGSQVINLPLNGRSLYQLVALQPGVTSGLTSGYVGVGLDVTQSINVNGGRSSQNNWLVDGADNNDTGSNLALISYVSVDAISEFRVLRGNYNAEFGRNGGGQVNVITKSGGNEFHGSAFEFWRNNALDARNYFRSDCDILAAAGKSHVEGKDCGASYLRYHNFGYGVGGPIVKNKLFFYWNEEFRRTRRVAGSGVVLGRVPTDLEKAGNFSATPGLTTLFDPTTCTPHIVGGVQVAPFWDCTAFAGNVIPANRMDPNAKLLLALFPAGNQAFDASNRNYQTATASARDYREELIKIDYSFSDHHKIWGRWIQDKIPSSESFGELFGTRQTILPNISNLSTNIPSRGLVVEYNWIPSATVINNLAFNYSFGGILSQNTGQYSLRTSLSGFNVDEIFPANAGGTIPAVNFGTSGGNFNGWAGFLGPYDNTYGAKRIKENLTMIKGTHTLKMGYLYSWEFKNENANGNTTYGSFSFPGASTTSYVASGSAFADFLLGRSSSYTENDIDIASHLRYDMHEAYFQDDWKARPNLTFNLGVRWSYIRSPIDETNTLSNFVPAMYNPANAPTLNGTARVPGTGDPLNGMIIAGQNSPYGRRIVEDDIDTIGPRLGFAYDPKGDGKTAIRGGYGWYFDRILSGVALQNAFVNPPFVNTALYSSDESTTTTCTGTRGFSGFNGAACTPTFDNPSGGAARNAAAVVPATIISISPNFDVPTVQHWSLGIQRELPWKSTLEVTYVGNHGTHLLREVRINQTAPGAATSTAAAMAIAKFKGYQNIRERQTTAGSRYDGLQVGWNKQHSHGVQIGAAYTWSKAITDSPDDRSTLPQDLRNLRAERALASYDRTHVFNANFLWDLPTFAKDKNSPLYYFFGGWQAGGIWRIESGVPLTIAATNNSNSFFGGSFRANVSGDPNGLKTFSSWFNTGAFTQPATNAFGNSSRSLVRGPGLQLWDMTLYKNIRVHEGMNLQFRADAFNVFNHTNWAGVGTTVGVAGFGTITSAREPRQIQLGARFSF